MTTLYRACDGYTGCWSCWTPDVQIAELYKDNPGYGGATIVECEAAGEVLCVESFGDLADAIASDMGEDPRDLEQKWRDSGYGWVYEAWENRQDVRDAISKKYAWIMHHQETYPELAETWVKAR